MAASVRAHKRVSRKPRVERAPIIRVWAWLGSAATGSVGMCPAHYVAFSCPEVGRPVGRAFAHLPTASGSGEPKGNGAASRFPFPLPKPIIAKKKRKSSAYDLILGRIAARCSLTKQFL